jgi:hypothetical protein
LASCALDSHGRDPRAAGAGEARDVIVARRDAGGAGVRPCVGGAARRPEGPHLDVCGGPAQGCGGKTHIPDGAIVVERGKTTWRCLVEVKTGAAELKDEQVNRYLDMARENRLNAVLTLSNQITGAPAETPVSVDRRKLRSVGLVHLSWWRILTEAIVQHRHRGVSDPDQAWILGELIAYLDDERSGASGFRDMGENWVAVRNGAATTRSARATPRCATSPVAGSSSSSTSASDSARISVATCGR